MKNIITNETKEQVKDLFFKWESLIVRRNNSEYGSARYNKAVEKSDAIENEASMLVFGDTSHTMLEAYDTVTAV